MEWLYWMAHSIYRAIQTRSLSKIPIPIETTAWDSMNGLLAFLSYENIINIKVFDFPRRYSPTARQINTKTAEKAVMVVGKLV